MLTSILIPFLLKYYKEFVAKNTSPRYRTWDLSTFRDFILVFILVYLQAGIYGLFENPFNI